MNHQEEQEGEMEALLSIYEGELEGKWKMNMPLIQIHKLKKSYICLVLTSEPRYVFTMPIKTEQYDPDVDESGLFTLLKFTFTPKYPEEPPKIEIEEQSDNLTIDGTDTKFLAHLNEQVIDEKTRLPNLFYPRRGVRFYLQCLSLGGRKFGHDNGLHNHFCGHWMVGIHMGRIKGFQRGTH